MVTITHPDLKMKSQPTWSFTLFYQWVGKWYGCLAGGHCIKGLQSGQVIITTPRLENRRVGHLKCKFFMRRILSSILSCHGSPLVQNMRNMYPPRYHLSHFELLPTIQPLQAPGNLGSSAMIPGSWNFERSTLRSQTWSQTWLNA